MALLIGLGGGTIVLFAIIALFSHRLPAHGASTSSAPPQWSTTARLLGAASLGIAGMMSMLAVVSTAAQRGLSDAAEAADITPWVPVFFVVSAGLAVAGWFLQPKVQFAPAASEPPAEPLPLADHERAVWMKTVGIARSGQMVLGIGVFLTIAMSVLLLARGVAAGWIVAVIALILVILVASGLSVPGPRERRGSPGALGSGLATTRDPRHGDREHPGGSGQPLRRVRRLGLPLRHGRAARIRPAHRRRALEVTRTDGRVFVVTVDDAATAASVPGLGRIPMTTPLGEPEQGENP